MTYKLTHDVHDTHGQLRAKTGDKVKCRKSSTPGYVRITCAGLFETLIPALWVKAEGAE